MEKLPTPAEVVNPKLITDMFTDGTGNGKRSKRHIRGKNNRKI